jgi:hypothetical protein
VSNYSSFPLTTPLPTGYEGEAAIAYGSYQGSMVKAEIAKEYVLYVISGGQVSPQGAVFEPLDNSYQDMRAWFKLTYGDAYLIYYYTDGQSIVDAFNNETHGYDMRPITLQQANAIKTASDKYHEVRREIVGFAKACVAKSGKAILNGEQLSSTFITRVNSAVTFLKEDPNYRHGPNPFNYGSDWAPSIYTGLVFLAFDMDSNSGQARGEIIATLKEDYIKRLKGDEAEFNNSIKMGTPTSFDSISRIHYLYTRLPRMRPTPRSDPGRRIVTTLVMKHLAKNTYGEAYDHLYYKIKPNESTTLYGHHIANAQLKSLYPGNPNAFWYYQLSRRIVIDDTMGGTSCDIYLVKADLKTGALIETPSRTNKVGMVVGDRVKAHSEISQYLPHIPVYSQVDNVSVDNKQIQKMYSADIEASPKLKTWLETNNKSAYQFAFVLQSSWKPNESHFVDSTDVVTAREGYAGMRGKFDQYGKPADPQLKDYLKKEAFSQHLRKERGVTQIASGAKLNLRNNAMHYQDYLGPFNGNATAKARAQAMWAYSGRTEYKGLTFSDYSINKAINALDLPSKLSENIFSGEGSRYTSTLYALAIANPIVERAKEFMSKRVPVLVAQYLTEASASGNTGMGRFLAENTSFSTMGQNVPVMGLSDRRYISTWAEIFGKAITHYSNAPESLFISDFKKVLEETVGKWGANARYGQDNWEVPYAYGTHYDKYMGLLGACAVLSNGQAFMPTVTFPAFLSDAQKGHAQYLLNTYVLGGEARVISDFSINDTSDVHAVHSFLSKVGALNNMQEAPVFDVPSFHIRFKPKGQTTANYVSDPRIQVQYVAGNGNNPIFRVPGMAIDAFAFEGEGEDQGYGNVFHRQIVQTTTLYNNFRIATSSTANHVPTMTSNTRVPINTTGTVGGSYGLTAGRTLSLSQVAIRDGSALKISPSFKFTSTQLLGGGTLIYSLILGAGIVKALRQGRYL